MNTARTTLPVLSMLGLVVASGTAVYIGCANDASRSARTRNPQGAALCYTLSEIPRRENEGHSVVALDERGRLLVGKGSAFDTPRVRSGAFVWDGARHDLRAATDRPTSGVFATDMNEASVIVGGEADDEGNGRPLVWRDGGSARVLDVPGGVGRAEAVNERGDILVNAGSVLSPRAYLWRDGSWVDLGAGTAHQLNDRGDVVLSTAEVPPEAPAYRAFGVLWRDGKRTELSLAGAFDTSVGSLNERGDVVGTANFLDGRSQALLFRESGSTVLPTVLLGLGPSRSASAWAMNDRGDVVGWSELSDSPLWATLWRDGRAIEVWPGTTELSVARLINNRGRVAGEFLEGAFVWESGASAELPSSAGLGESTHPRVINESNVIAGTVSSEHGYDSRVVLWRPCSAPPTDAGSPETSEPPPTEEPTEE